MKKINYKSDFDFLLRLSDCEGKVVGWPEWDWEARFWTSTKANVFVASCRDGVCSNCFNDDGVIHVVANDHKLSAGQLQVEFVAYLPNSIYSDEDEKVVAPVPLDVELIRAAAPCPDSFEVEMMLPYIKMTWEDMTEADKEDLASHVHVPTEQEGAVARSGDGKYIFSNGNFASTKCVLTAGNTKIFQNADGELRFRKGRWSQSESHDESSGDYQGERIPVATPSADGVMSKEDKAKAEEVLDLGVVANSKTAYEAASQPVVVDNPRIREIHWRTSDSSDDGGRGDGGTIFQTRYGSWYVRQWIMFEGSNKSCYVRSITTGGNYSVGAWQKLILPTAITYTQSDRTVKSTDANNATQTLFTLPLATASVSGLMPSAMYSRLGTGMSMSATRTATSVTVSYPNYQTGASRTFSLLAATASYAGVMTAADKKKLDNLDATIATQLAEVKEETAALRADFDALYDILKESVIVPQVRARLAAIGYTAEEIDKIIASFGERINLNSVALREGLSTLNYTTTEIEECLEDVPALTMDDIKYSKEFMDSYDTSLTSWNQSTFFGGAINEDIVVFPKIDTSNLKTIYMALGGMPNLRYFPKIDVSNVTSSSYMWLRGSSEVNAPKIKRLPDFDWDSLTGQVRIYSVRSELKYIPSPVRLPVCRGLNQLYSDASGLKAFPKIECNPDIVTSYSTMYRNCPQVTEWPEFPSPDFPDVATTIDGMLRGTSFEDLSDITVRGSNITNLSETFRFCRRLRKAPMLEVPKVTNMRHIFHDCTALTEVPDYSQLAPKDFYGFVVPMTAQGSLQAVRGLNFANATNTTYVFGYDTSSYRHKSLSYIRILNLGQGPCTEYDFTGTESWGTGGDENMQSLIDSLITNSFNRAEAEMPIANIKLPKAVVERLSDAQKAEITAKGFSIVQVNNAF